MINFAIHLVRHGLISPWQFVEALETELSSRKRLGQIALEKRILTIAQVFNILKQQVDDHRPFGKIAVDLGYLTEEDLSSLLVSQSEDKESLSTILVAIGAIDSETLEQERGRYYGGVADNSNSAGTIAYEAIPSADLLVQ